MKCPLIEVDPRTTLGIYDLINMYIASCITREFLKHCFDIKDINRQRNQLLSLALTLLTLSFSGLSEEILVKEGNLEGN